MTDTELLLRVQRGDLTAWDALYARCLPTVWRHACALAADRTVAEEIVSETLLALVRSLPSLDPDAVHLHGWLRGVVQHKAADLGRQSVRQRRLLAAARYESNGSESTDAVSLPMETEETRQDVLAALERMSELQRLVLEWKHADEQSVREIATRLGQSEKSIESLLYRARKEFRRLYELECADHSRSERSRDAHTSPLEKSL